MLIIKPCEWKGGIRHAISIDLLSGMYTMGPNNLWTILLAKPIWIMFVQILSLEWFNENIF